MSLTPIGDTQFEFWIENSQQYDLIAIFQKESVPTNITYGSLNEERRECSVRIDTTMDNFQAWGGESTFEENMAKQIGVKQRYFDVQKYRVGSVIVDYDIISDKNNHLSIDEMKEKQDEALLAGQNDLLGGKILSFTSYPDLEVITYEEKTE